MECSCGRRKSPKGTKQPGTPGQRRTNYPKCAGPHTPSQNRTLSASSFQAAGCSDVSIVNLKTTGSKAPPNHDPDGDSWFSQTFTHVRSKSGALVLECFVQCH